MAWTALSYGGRTAPCPACVVLIMFMLGSNNVCQTIDRVALSSRQPNLPRTAPGALQAARSRNGIIAC